MSGSPSNIIRIYYRVFVSLMVLLALTVGVYYLPVPEFIGSISTGPVLLIVALAIAIGKAVLVILFFMHAKYSSKSVWLYATAGFAWLIIAFVLTMADYLTRPGGSFHL